ncbi:Xaa-Pro dipeptidase, metalloprotease family M24B, partial [Phytophthora palmivora]
MQPRLLVAATAAKLVLTCIFLYQQRGRLLQKLKQYGRLVADPAEGYELFPIDFSMHVQIRQNVVRRFLQTHPEAKNSAAALLLHGGVEVDRYDTDIQYNFHQESFFQYLFGVREPG